MTVLKSSLPLFRTSSLSSSDIDANVPQPITNNTDTSYSYRTPSRSFVESNNVENHSNSMSSSTYRSSSFSVSKPCLFQETREKERFELSTLNDQFADYVEKVRYLESQNKKLQIDSNFLNEKQEENCQKIKTMFEIEISEVKEAIENLFKDKNTIFTTAQNARNSILPLKLRLTQTFKDCDSSKYETEKIERQLSSIDGDILMFKRRLAHQDTEYTQWKHFIAHIQRLSYQANNEIHSENLARTSSEQTTKQLRSDINKLHEQQQEKLHDVKQRSFLLGSNSANDRAHIFKSELSSAIRRIRQDFERQNDLQRNELYEQFTKIYEDIAREYSDIGYLFSNEREQERVRQEEERIRLEIQRIRTDSHILKKQNSEFQLRIRELQINLQMTLDENHRIEQFQQNEVNQWKLKHENVIRDYEDVITKQISLENEIETYRNLLEGGFMNPDAYNSIPVNQTKLEQENSCSSSIDRSLLTSPYPVNMNDTNSFTSNYDNNQSTDSVLPIVDSSITNGNDSATSESNEDLNVKNNDNDQGMIEKTEEIKDTSPPRVIVKIRRNS